MNGEWWIWVLLPVVRVADAGIEEADVYLLTEGISYDVMSRTIRRGRETVRLAPQAAALFLLFLRTEGHRVTCEEINRSLWYGKGSKSVVHAAIKRLRGRLRDNGLPLEIINHGDCYLLKGVTKHHEIDVL